VRVCGILVVLSYGAQPLPDCNFKFIDTAGMRSAVPIVLVVTHNRIATAAWISIQDFREVCKAVDSEIRAEVGGIFAQRRTLDKAMEYADALSDPRVPGRASAKSVLE
jgi:hypothetical protein